MLTQKTLLRGGALVLGLILLASLAACHRRDKPASGNTQEPAPTLSVSDDIRKTPSALTVVSWKDCSDATFKEDGSDAAPNTALAGKTTDGRDIFTFMRFDIGVEFLENEVYDARLFLKVIGEDKPALLRLGLVTTFWDSLFTPYDEAKSFVDEDSVIAVAVNNESDGWISVPLTEYVRKWLCGGMQNNGIAIWGETAGETFTFVSIIGSDVSDDDTAYIKVSGTVGDRPLIYGEFGYTEIVTPDDMHSNGNCMSYALRDTNAILESDLGADINEMERIYTEAGAGKGLDALADYFARLAAEYVEAHKTGLEISNFRQLNSFDSEIDPVAEYRIALRVGVNLFGGEADFSDEHSWDFHYWVQLNDGRWAQKFPPVSSVIVPCTGPGIPPDRFPWDSANHRTNKTADYYQSKVVCFAVTKDTAVFTQHRGETEDRPLEP